MRILQTTIAFTALLIIGLYSCSPSIDESKEPNAGATAQPAGEANKLPAFTITDATGNKVDLANFKGKKVFVNLWATWCPPCKAEIPSIENLASKVDKEKVVFIMLSLDENFEVAKTFAEAQGLKAPVYYPAEKLPALFDTDGIPATFIFDSNGVLVKQNNGADNYDTDEYIKLLSTN